MDLININILKMCDKQQINIEALRIKNSKLKVMRVKLIIF